jgi:ubiquinone/menaquinone biosynthesis C-methylase UbiE
VREGCINNLETSLQGIPDIITLYQIHFKSIIFFKREEMAYQHETVNADDSAVTSLYGDRSAVTSCAYLLPHITKTASILDVGCGPGIITSDLAKLAPEGQTIGIDNSAGVITQAQSSHSLPNLSFAVGDATNLSYPDNTFDIVHAHQLLVHCPDPISILKEFYRVCKPGGLIAVRESCPSTVLSLKPDLPSIRAYWARAMVIMGKMGGQTEAGYKLEEWAKEAGLDANGARIETSMSPMKNPSHLGRVSGVPAEQAVQYAMATKEEVDAWREGWEEWEKAEGSEFVFETGEILCWKRT